MRKPHKMMKSVVAICVTTLALTACSVDDFTYQDTARVRLEGPEIYAAGTDSLTFSFVTYSSDTQEKVMDIDVLIMGNVADYDRIAAIQVVADQTTASSDLYELPLTVTVPAGEVKGTLPVTLKRSEALQTKAVRLCIEVASSSDFQVGVEEQKRFTLIWNDILTMPSNWDELEEFFGSYSNTKYRFMIENSDGITEFDADTMSWAQLQSYKMKFQNALNDYNDAHPSNPLRDENGVLVSFN